MKSLAKLLITAATPLMVATTTTLAAELSDADVENLVKRSYQYVAMYNVINKNALMKESPPATGWNGTWAGSSLADHATKIIARLNDYTLYVAGTLDLRAEPIIVNYPAFDSKYVSLLTSAYDHYVNIPLTTTKGDFEKPTNVLFYTRRAQG
jgi:hypothetical protein